MCRALPSATERQVSRNALFCPSPGTRCKSRADTKSDSSAGAAPTLEKRPRAGLLGQRVDVGQQLLVRRGSPTAGHRGAAFRGSIRSDHGDRRRGEDLEETLPVPGLQSPCVGDEAPVQLLGGETVEPLPQRVEKGREPEGAALVALGAHERSLPDHQGAVWLNLDSATTGDYFVSMKAVGIKQLKSKLSEYVRPVRAERRSW